ncbi:hypothetical protein [Nonomuraea lactucae]|nr:hypothetical protein [Nonomuraea lactucae]
MTGKHEGDKSELEPFKPPEDEKNKGDGVGGGGGKHAKDGKGGKEK